MQRRLMIACLAALPIAAPAQRAPVRRVTPIEAFELVKNRPDALVLDVRTPEEYAEGHVLGALNVPLADIQADRIPMQATDKSRLYILHCRSGRRSEAAAQTLRMRGYTNLVDFGSINGWPGALVR